MKTRIRKPKVKSTKRSRVMQDVLRREGREAASRPALSRFARSAARRRGPASLRRSARKAVATKGPQVLHEEAVKAARTRERTVR